MPVKHGPGTVNSKVAGLTQDLAAATVFRTWVDGARRVWVGAAKFDWQVLNTLLLLSRVCRASDTFSTSGE